MEIRSLVVDDHELVAAAMSRALDRHADITVVGRATTMDEAAHLVAVRCPDVALVDLRIGPDLALDRLAELGAASPSTRVLIVTGWTTEHTLDQALAAGARGMVSKTRSMDELVSAVRRVHAGELVVPPELVQVMVERSRSASGAPSLDGREQSVLELLAQARSTGEIADHLCISSHTVRTRIGTLMGKLGTHTRGETVSEALRRGLLLPVEPGMH